MYIKISVQKYISDTLSAAKFSNIEPNAITTFDPKTNLQGSRIDLYSQTFFVQIHYNDT